MFVFTTLPAYTLIDRSLSTSRSMTLDWARIPSEFLFPILKLLSSQDLCRAAAVSHKWRQVAGIDEFWREHCRELFVWSGEHPKILDTFFQEYSFFKNRIPRSVKTIIDDYYYPLKQVVFSPDGIFMVVTGFPTYLCIYKSSSLELLDERCMQESLYWEKIEQVQFSPDSRKLLINGHRPNSPEKTELAIYEITESLDVHFLCRLPSSPSSFYGCWFDSDHLLVSELYPLSSPVATSISQIFLVTLPLHRNAPSDFFPILRFLNRHGPVRWPLVAATASPRFRRVVQLSQQARQENKTLSQKLSELELSGAVHLEGDLSELREVLDKEQQCFRCYLKHQLTNEEYGTDLPLDCGCMCHQIINRLLIFVVKDDAEEKIGFKLIGNEILNDTFNMKRFKVEDNETDDLWQFIARRVDEIDHVIPIGGTVMNMKLSTDHKQLIVTVDTGSTGIRLRSIDLDKMVLDVVGFHWRGESEGDLVADVGSNVVVGVRGNRLNMWSRYHLGIPIGDLEAKAGCVAVHPVDEYVVALSDMQLYVWETSSGCNKGK